MEQGSDERFALPPKWSAVIFVTLTLLGLAGNYLSYEIFFNLQFIFGSIGALLVLQCLGLRWGVVAAFLISLITYKLWNHPYFIVIMTVESLVVGMLHQRRGLGLVLADALYWLFLGIPLVILFYYGVMHLPFYNVGVTMMKQAVNGVVNALVARLIFLGAGYGRKRPSVSLRELIFSLLVLFLLSPSLLLLSLQSREELERTELSVHQALKFGVARTAPLVDRWLTSRLDNVEYLAWMAARQPLPMMQLSLEYMRLINPDFLRMGLLDRTETTVAFVPLVNDQGQSNLGVNFSDRPYVPELKKTLEPMLSEVVMARLGFPSPIVIALAPVKKAGVYAGYVSGILDLDRARQIIELNIKAVSLPEVQFVLLDRNGNIIVSSYPGVMTNEPFRRKGGELLEVGDGIGQWLPDNTRNISISDRWKKALLVIESRLGGKSDWRLILEQPLAPFQKLLYERYAIQLSIVFAMLLAGLALAEITSRMFVRSLRKVGFISTGIPAKILAGVDIAWPHSAIIETNALMGNFNEMSKELIRQYVTIQVMNSELERRVEERTRELHESEARYRQLFENNHSVMLIVDPDSGDIVDANPAAAAFYGWNRAELKTKKIHEINTASRDEISEKMNLARTHSVDRLSFAHRRADGTIRDVEVFPGPIQSRGKTLLVSIVHDVTERRLAEQRISDAMNYIEVLMRTSPVGIATYKASGETVSANAACARIAGATIESLEKQNFRSLASWKQFGLLTMAEEALATGEEQRGDCSMVTSFGNRVELDCHFVPFMFGGEPHLMLVVMDITERRKVEDALRKSEERYRSLMEASAQIVWTCDPGGAITEYSPSWQAYTGQVLDQEGGVGYVGCIHPEDRESVMALWQEALQKGVSVSAELRLRHHSGDWRWNNVRAVPIRDKAGVVESWIGTYTDIEDRKQAEERNRQLAQELRMILDTLMVGVSFLKNRRVQWANPAFASTLGYRLEETFNLDALRIYAHADDYRRIGDEGYAQLATGGVYTTEVEAKRSDGTTFWCSLTGRAVNPGDLGEGSIWMFQDVSKRKQAEAALQASELKYRQLVEAANSVILRWDNDGSIRFINEFGARFFGYTPEELVGKNVLGTIVPEVDSAGNDLARMVGKIGSEPERFRSNENENLTKDGRRVWVRWENRVILDAAGKPTGILSIGYDNTERKKVDEALRESEERFRTLFESAEIGVFIHAEDGRLLEANRKALADNGVESIEALRNREFWLPEPYSMPDALRWLQKAAAAGTQRFEWQDRDRQGGLYWRDMTLKKTTLNGQPRIIAIAVDITDRKRAEAALQSKTQQLEALTKTLEERVREEVAGRLKNEQLLVQQAKLAAMGEMLGAVAHQWRQPLNTLGLCVQNINDAYAHGDLDASYLDKTVGKSMDQIRHMSKTIDDFRDFFQPDKERAEFDTMRAVGNVLALFSAQLQANHIGFILTCRTHGRSFTEVREILCCQEKQVAGFRNEFEHVILNLISNAKDAILGRRAAHGGEPENGRLSFDFLRSERGVVIEVGDNGGGIPEAILPRIFEPYFTTKAPAKGTGIGLYMSRIIIEDHMHGTLTAENGPEGARLRITLPQTGEGAS